MKRTLHIFSCLVFILFSQVSYGQLEMTNDSITNFIRNYQPPNYTYTSLTISPSLSQSSSNSDFYNSSNFSLQARVFFVLRNQKDKSNTQIYAGLNERFKSGKTNDVKTSGNNFINHSVTTNGSKDFYFKEKVFFSAGYSYDGSAARTLLEDWEYNDNHRLDIPLGIGFGRPYSVRSAWMATTYFNDLECNGLAVDRSNTKEFADLLSTQRFRRIIDSRLNRIKNQTEIFSFLQDKQVAEFNPLTAAIINDSYRFENFVERLAGFRMLLGVKPGLRNNTNRTSTTEISSTDYFFSPFLQLGYFLPFSEDWQFNLNTFLDYENNFTTVTENRKTALCSVEVSWLPNYRIRSSLAVVYNATFSEFFDYNSVDLGYSLNYYFSPQVSLDFDASVRQTWTENQGQNNTNFNHRISLGIAYSIL